MAKNKNSTNYNSGLYDTTSWNNFFRDIIDNDSVISQEMKNVLSRALQENKKITRSRLSSIFSELQNLDYANVLSDLQHLTKNSGDLFGEFSSKFSPKKSQIDDNIEYLSDVSSGTEKTLRYLKKVASKQAQELNWVTKIAKNNQIIAEGYDYAGRLMRRSTFDETSQSGHYSKKSSSNIFYDKSGKMISKTERTPYYQIDDNGVVKKQRGVLITKPDGRTISTQDANPITQRRTRDIDLRGDVVQASVKNINQEKLLKLQKENEQLYSLFNQGFGSQGRKRYNKLDMSVPSEVLTDEVISNRIKELNKVTAKSVKTFQGVGHKRINSNIFNPKKIDLDKLLFYDFETIGEKGTKNFTPTQVSFTSGKNGTESFILKLSEAGQEYISGLIEKVEAGDFDKLSENDRRSLFQMADYSLDEQMNKIVANHRNISLSKKITADSDIFKKIKTGFQLLKDDKKYSNRWDHYENIKEYFNSDKFKGYRKAGHNIHTFDNEMLKSLGVEVGEFLDTYELMQEYYNFGQERFYDKHGNVVTQKDGVASKRLLRMNLESLADYFNIDTSEIAKKTGGNQHVAEYDTMLNQEIYKRIMDDIISKRVSSVKKGHTIKDIKPGSTFVSGKNIFRNNTQSFKLDSKGQRLRESGNSGNSWNSLLFRDKGIYSFDGVKEIDGLTYLLATDQERGEQIYHAVEDMFGAENLMNYLSGGNFIDDSTKIDNQSLALSSIFKKDTGFYNLESIVNILSGSKGFSAIQQNRAKQIGANKELSKIIKSIYTSVNSTELNSEQKNLIMELIGKKIGISQQETFSSRTIKNYIDKNSTGTVSSIKDAYLSFLRDNSYGFSNGYEWNSIIDTIINMQGLSDINPAENDKILYGINEWINNSLSDSFKQSHSSGVVVPEILKGGNEKQVANIISDSIKKVETLFRGSGNSVMDLYNIIDNQTVKEAISGEHIIKRLSKIHKDPKKIEESLSYLKKTNNGKFFDGTIGSYLTEIEKVATDNNLGFRLQPSLDGTSIKVGFYDPNLQSDVFQVTTDGLIPLFEKMVTAEIPLDNGNGVIRNGSMDIANMFTPSIVNGELFMKTSSEDVASTLLDVVRRKSFQKNIHDGQNKKATNQIKHAIRDVLDIAPSGGTYRAVQEAMSQLKSGGTPESMGVRQYMTNIKSFLEQTIRSYYVQDPEKEIYDSQISQMMDYFALSSRGQEGVLKNDAMYSWIFNTLSMSDFKSMNSLFKKLQEQIPVTIDGIKEETYGQQMYSGMGASKYSLWNLLGTDSFRGMNQAGNYLARNRLSKKSNKKYNIFENKFLSSTGFQLGLNASGANSQLFNYGFITDDIVKKAYENLYKTGKYNLPDINSVSLPSFYDDGAIISSRLSTALDNNGLFRNKEIFVKSYEELDNFVKNYRFQGANINQIQNAQDGDYITPYGGGFTLDKNIDVGKDTLKEGDILKGIKKTKDGYIIDLSARENIGTSFKGLTGFGGRHMFRSVEDALFDEILKVAGLDTEGAYRPDLLLEKKEYEKRFDPKTAPQLVGGRYQFAFSEAMRLKSVDEIKNALSKTQVLKNFVKFNEHGHIDTDASYDMFGNLLGNDGTKLFSDKNGLSSETLERLFYDEDFQYVDEKGNAYDSELKTFWKQLFGDSPLPKNIIRSQFRIADIFDYSDAYGSIDESVSNIESRHKMSKRETDSIKRKLRLIDKKGDKTSNLDNVLNSYLEKKSRGYEKDVKRFNAYNQAVTDTLAINNGNSEDYEKFFNDNNIIRVVSNLDGRELLDNEISLEDLQGGFGKFYGSGIQLHDWNDSPFGKILKKARSLYGNIDNVKLVTDFGGKTATIDGVDSPISQMVMALEDGIHNNGLITPTDNHRKAMEIWKDLYSVHLNPDSVKLQNSPTEYIQQLMYEANSKNSELWQSVNSVKTPNSIVPEATGVNLEQYNSSEFQDKFENVVQLNTDDIRTMLKSNSVSIRNKNIRNLEYYLRAIKGLSEEESKKLFDDYKQQAGTSSKKGKGKGKLNKDKYEDFLIDSIINESKNNALYGGMFHRFPSNLDLDMQFVRFMANDAIKSGDSIVPVGLAKHIKMDFDGDRGNFAQFLMRHDFNSFDEYLKAYNETKTVTDFDTRTNKILGNYYLKEFERSISGKDLTDEEKNNAFQKYSTGRLKKKNQFVEGVISKLNKKYIGGFSDFATGIRNVLTNHNLDEMSGDPSVYVQSMITRAIMSSFEQDAISAKNVGDRIQSSTGSEDDLISGLSNLSNMLLRNKKIDNSYFKTTDEKWRGLFKYSKKLGIHGQDDDFLGGIHAANVLATVESDFIDFYGDVEKARVEMRKMGLKPLSDEGSGTISYDTALNAVLATERRVSGGNKYNSMTYQATQPQNKIGSMTPYNYEKWLKDFAKKAGMASDMLSGKKSKTDTINTPYSMTTNFIGGVEDVNKRASAIEGEMVVEEKKTAVAQALAAALLAESNAFGNTKDAEKRKKVIGELAEQMSQLSMASLSVNKAIGSSFIANSISSSGNGEDLLAGDDINQFLSERGIRRFTSAVRMRGVEFTDLSTDGHKYIDKITKEPINIDLSASKMGIFGTEMKDHERSPFSILKKQTLESIMNDGSSNVRVRGERNDEVKNIENILALEEFTQHDFSSVARELRATLIGNASHKIMELAIKEGWHGPNLNFDDIERNLSKSKGWSDYLTSNAGTSSDMDKYSRISYGSNEENNNQFINKAISNANALMSIQSELYGENGLIKKFGELSLVGEYYDHNTGANLKIGGTFDALLGNMIFDYKTSGSPDAKKFGMQLATLVDLIQSAPANQEIGFNPEDIYNAIMSAIVVKPNGEAYRIGYNEFSQEAKANMLNNVLYNIEMQKLRNDPYFSNPIFSKGQLTAFSNPEMSKEFLEIQRGLNPKESTIEDVKQLLRGSKYKIGKESQKAGSNSRTIDFYKTDDLGNIYTLQALFSDSTFQGITANEKIKDPNETYNKILNEQFKLLEEAGTYDISGYMSEDTIVKISDWVSKIQRNLASQTKLRNNRDMYLNFDPDNLDMEFLDTHQGMLGVTGSLEEYVSKFNNIIDYGRYLPSKEYDGEKYDDAVKYQDLYKNKIASERYISDIEKTPQSIRTDYQNMMYSYYQQLLKNVEEQMKNISLSDERKQQIESSTKKLDKDTAENISVKESNENISNVDRIKQNQENINQILERRKSVYKELINLENLYDDKNNANYLSKRAELEELLSLLNKDADSILTGGNFSSDRISEYRRNMSIQDEEYEKNSINQNYVEQKSARSLATKEAIADIKELHKMQRDLEGLKRLPSSVKNRKEISDLEKKIADFRKTMARYDVDKKGVYDRKGTFYAYNDEDNAKMGFNIDEENKKFEESLIKDRMTFQKQQMTLSGFFKRMGKQTVSYFGMSMSYAIIGSIRQVVSSAIAQTKQLDQNMVNLQIVTGNNRNEVYSLIKGYNSFAKQLGVTTQEIMESANNFLRMGYSVADTNELIKQSTILAKVGMIDSAKAAEYLTSAIKGYKLEANEASQAIDMATTLDMDYAVDTGYIFEAMARTANSAKLAKMEMSELQSIIAVTGETTQRDASVVGEGIKTALARFGNVKAGVASKQDMQTIGDEEGVDLEKVNDIEKVLSKYNISMRESDNKTWRSYSDVLKDINKQWAKFSDFEKNAISTAMFGTRQREIGLTVLENYGRVLQANEKAMNSAGSSSRKFKQYQDGMEAATNRLSASWEKFIIGIKGNDALKNLINIFSFLLENLNSILVVTGLLTVAFKGDKLLKGFFTISNLFGTKIHGFKIFGKALWNPEKWGTKNDTPEFFGKTRREVIDKGWKKYTGRYGTVFNDANKEAQDMEKHSVSLIKTKVGSILDVLTSIDSKITAGRKPYEKPDATIGSNSTTGEKPDAIIDSSTSTGVNVTSNKNNGVLMLPAEGETTRDNTASWDKSTTEDNSPTGRKPYQKPKMYKSNKKPLPNSTVHDGSPILLDGDVIEDNSSTGRKPYQKPKMYKSNKKPLPNSTVHDGSPILLGGDVIEDNSSTGKYRLNKNKYKPIRPISIDKNSNYYTIDSNFNSDGNFVLLDSNFDYGDDFKYNKRSKYKLNKRKYGQILNRRQKEIMYENLWGNDPYSVDSSGIERIERQKMYENMNFDDNFYESRRSRFKLPENNNTVVPLIQRPAFSGYRVDKLSGEIDIYRNQNSGILEELRLLKNEKNITNSEINNLTKEKESIQKNMIGMKSKNQISKSNQRISEIDNQLEEKRSRVKNIEAREVELTKELRNNNLRIQELTKAIDRLQQTIVSENKNGVKSNNTKNVATPTANVKKDTSSSTSTGVNVTSNKNNGVLMLPAEGETTRDNTASWDKSKTEDNSSTSKYKLNNKKYSNPIIPNRWKNVKNVIKLDDGTVVPIVEDPTLGENTSLSKINESSKYRLNKNKYKPIKNGQIVNIDGKNYEYSYKKGKISGKYSSKTNPAIDNAKAMGGMMIGTMGGSSIGSAIGGALGNEQVGSAIGSIVGSVTGMVSPMIGAAIGGIGAIVSLVKSHHEKMERIAVEAYQKSQEKLNKANDLQSQIKRYDILARGVDNFGNNIALSDDEYEEFKDLGNKIADVFPELIQKSDSLGNSFLGLDGNIGNVSDSFNNLIKQLEIETSKKAITKDAWKTTIGYEDAKSQKSDLKKQKKNSDDYKDYTKINSQIAEYKISALNKVRRDSEYVDTSLAIKNKLDDEGIYTFEELYNNRYDLYDDIYINDSVREKKLLELEQTYDKIKNLENTRNETKTQREENQATNQIVTAMVSSVAPHLMNVYGSSLSDVGQSAITMMLKNLSIEDLGNQEKVTNLLIEGASNGFYGVEYLNDLNNIDKYSDTVSDSMEKSNYVIADILDANRDDDGVYNESFLKLIGRSADYNATSDDIIKTFNLVDYNEMKEKILRQFSNQQGLEEKLNNLSTIELQNLYKQSDLELQKMKGETADATINNLKSLFYSANTSSYDLFKTMFGKYNNSSIKDLSENDFKDYLKDVANGTTVIDESISDIYGNLEKMADGLNMTIEQLVDNIDSLKYVTKQGFSDRKLTELTTDVEKYASLQQNLSNGFISGSDLEMIFGSDIEDDMIESAYNSAISGSDFGVNTIKGFATKEKQSIEESAKYSIKTMVMNSKSFFDLIKDQFDGQGVNFSLNNYGEAATISRYFGEKYDLKGDAEKFGSDIINEIGIGDKNRLAIIKQRYEEEKGETFVNNSDFYKSLINSIGTEEQKKRAIDASEQVLQGIVQSILISFMKSINNNSYIENMLNSVTGKISKSVDLGEKQNRINAAWALDDYYEQEYQLEQQRKQLEKQKRQAERQRRKNEKQERDINAQERLNELEDFLQRRNLLIEQYNNKIDNLDWGLEILSEQDYIGRTELTAQKIEENILKEKALREQITEVSSINPQTADEAKKKADTLKDLTSQLRDVKKNGIEWNKVLKNMTFDAVTKSIEKMTDAIEKQQEIINRSSDMSSSLTNIGDTMLALSVNTLDIIDNDSQSEIDDKNTLYEDMIEEQQEFERISLESQREYLDLQKKENAENIEEQRLDLQESKQDLEDNLESAQHSYNQALTNFAKMKQDLFNQYGSYISEQITLTENELTRLKSIFDKTAKGLYTIDRSGNIIWNTEYDTDIDSDNFVGPPELKTDDFVGPPEKKSDDFVGSPEPDKNSLFYNNPFNIFPTVKKNVEDSTISTILLDDKTWSDSKSLDVNDKNTLGGKILSAISNALQDALKEFNNVTKLKDIYRLKKPELLLDDGNSDGWGVNGLESDIINKLKTIYENIDSGILKAPTPDEETWTKFGELIGDYISDGIENGVLNAQKMQAIGNITLHGNGPDTGGIIDDSSYNIKKGQTMYFHSKYSPMYGHVGIYDGEGNIYHWISPSVRKNTLEEMQNNGYDYIGAGWNGGIPLTSEQSDSLIENISSGKTYNCAKSECQKWVSSAYQDVVGGQRVSGASPEWIVKNTNWLTTFNKPKEQNSNGLYISKDIALGKLLSYKFSDYIIDPKYDGLGWLSAKYESGNNPSRISSGVGDHGGKSYGIPQFSSKSGSADDFVRSLAVTAPHLYSLFGNSKAGSTMFDQAWITASLDNTFAQLQRDYAREIFAEPQIEKIFKKYGLDMRRSRALYEVALSAAYQYANITPKLLKGYIDGMSDEEIIRLIYKNKKDNVDSHFSSSSSDVRKGVSNRIDNELKDALSMLSYSTGTSYHKGGNALLGDENLLEGSNYPSPELLIYPDRKVEIVGEDGPVIKNIPTGTKVLTTKQTNELFNRIPHYADGTDVDTIEFRSKYGNYIDKTILDNLSGTSKDNIITFLDNVVAPLNININKIYDYYTAKNVSASTDIRNILDESIKNADSYEKIQKLKNEKSRAIDRLQLEALYEHANTLDIARNKALEEYQNAIERGADPEEISALAKSFDALDNAWSDIGSKIDSLNSSMSESIRASLDTIINLNNSLNEIEDEKYNLGLLGEKTKRSYYDKRKASYELELAETQKSQADWENYLRDKYRQDGYTETQIKDLIAKDETYLQYEKDKLGILSKISQNTSDMYDSLTTENDRKNASLATRYGDVNTWNSDYAKEYYFDDENSQLKTLINNRQIIRDKLNDPDAYLSVEQQKELQDEENKLTRDIINTFGEGSEAITTAMSNSIDRKISLLEGNENIGRTSSKKSGKYFDDKIELQEQKLDIAMQKIVDAEEKMGAEAIHLGLREGSNAYYEFIYNSELYQEALNGEIEVQQTINEIYKEKLDYQNEQIDNEQTLLDLAKSQEWSSVNQIQTYYRQTEQNIDQKISNLKDYMELESLSKEEYYNSQLQLAELEKQKFETQLQQKQDLQAFYEKQYSSMTFMVNEYIDALNDEKENVSDLYDEEIRKLELVNEAKERSVKLTELQNNLDNAKKEKKRVYRAGVGFVYEENREEIKKAEDELDNFYKQDQISSLQEAKEMETKILDDRIKAWNKYLEAIEKVYKTAERHEHMSILEDMLGVDGWKGIWDTLDSDLSNFMTKFDNNEKIYQGKWTGFLHTYEDISDSIFKKLKESVDLLNDIPDWVLTNELDTGGLRSNIPDNIDVKYQNGDVVRYNDKELSVPDWKQFAEKYNIRDFQAEQWTGEELEKLAKKYFKVSTVTDTHIAQITTLLKKMHGTKKNELVDFASNYGIDNIASIIEGSRVNDTGYNRYQIQDAYQLYYDQLTKEDLNNPGAYENKENASKIKEDMNKLSSTYIEYAIKNGDESARELLNSIGYDTTEIDEILKVKYKSLLSNKDFMEQVYSVSNMWGGEGNIFANDTNIKELLDVRKTIMKNLVKHGVNVSDWEKGILENNSGLHENDLHAVYVEQRKLLEDAINKYGNGGGINGLLDYMDSTNLKELNGLSYNVIKSLLEDKIYEMWSSGMLTVFKDDGITVDENATAQKIKKYLRYDENETSSLVDILRQIGIPSGVLSNKPDIYSGSNVIVVDGNGIPRLAQPKIDQSYMDLLAGKNLNPLGNVTNYFVLKNSNMIKPLMDAMVGLNNLNNEGLPNK